MAHIKLDLSRFSFAALIVELKKIAGKMTGNAAFTTQAANATALTTAVTALETANQTYETSKTETETKMTLRDNARIVAEDAARALANGAEGVTHDAALLQSGGWDLVAERSPVGEMSAPANFVATTGDDAGEVDLMCDTQRGVQTHIARYATSPDGPYTQGYVGRASSCTIPGLISGTAYWFQMQAVGAAGPGPWAGPITKRAA